VEKATRIRQEIIARFLRIDACLESMANHRNLGLSKW
jgi:hypothetical protein